MVMDNWWKPKYSEKMLSLCHSVTQKSHMDQLGIGAGPKKLATNRLNHDTAFWLHS
jgi:hypothetical protein